jgi:hypothetical protein
MHSLCFTKIILDKRSPKPKTHQKKVFIKFWGKFMHLRSGVCIVKKYSTNIINFLDTLGFLQGKISVYVDSINQYCCQYFIDGNQV